MTAGERRPDAAREAAAQAGARPAAARKAARLRPMAAADLEGVIALEHELFPEDPWTAQMFADEVAQPAEIRLYLVAEADDGSAERNGAGGRPPPPPARAPPSRGTRGCCSSPAASRPTC